MATKVRTVDYYYVQLPDKPGRGVNVLGGLAEAGVNLLATLGFPSGRGKKQLDLVPEDAAVFKKAAKKLGLQLTGPKKVFLVQGDDDRPGAMAEVVGRLGGESINITAAQSVSSGDGRWGMLLWVKPADVRKAGKVLGS